MKKSSAAQPLYRLIYCSQHASSIDRAAAEVELDVKSAEWRRRNEAAGITSALLSTGLGYAQALEGARDALDRIIDLIADDPRHTGVTVLSFTPTERRRFPDQALAVMTGLPPGATDPILGLRPDPEHDRPRMTTGGDVLRLLETMMRASLAPVP